MAPKLSGNANPHKRLRLYSRGVPSHHGLASPNHHPSRRRKRGIPQSLPENRRRLSVTLARCVSPHEPMLDLSLLMDG